MTPLHAFVALGTLVAAGLVVAGDWPRPAGRAVITSRYGERVHPVTGARTMHHGLDLRALQGSKLWAVTGGTVTKISTDRPIGGTSVTIDHGNGWRSSYSHLSAVFVKVGQRVYRSTLLGLTGGTQGTPGAGRSTGPHLHLQIWRRTPAGWQLVDPTPLLRWR